VLDFYDVGLRVRLLRRAAKLTQPELAKRSGISVQYIISLTKAERIPSGGAHGLGVISVEVVFNIS